MAILREQAEALIQEQIINEIMQDTPKGSVFMNLARRLPNMTSNQTKIPVLDMMPTASWVNGDTGLKSTSDQAWDKVYLTAAELAVIVPIPEAVLDDASFDIMGQVTPRVAEAIYQKVDQAVIFGVDRPAEWQNDIVTLARQAGNNVAAPTGNTDLYDSILGSSGVFGKVESGGFDVNGIVAGVATKASLRGLRTDDGLPIFNQSMQAAGNYTLAGVAMNFPTNGSFDTTIAQMVAGDWSQAVYAIRQDVTVKLLDQGVITNASGAIVYNLPQQDMVALRVVFRMGWALPNPATRMNSDRLYVPFAYLEPSSAVTTYTYTVTVEDSSATAIEGAIVDVNGSKLKTNASGVAVFNLRNGTYPVFAKATGKKKTTTSVTINSEAATATITLATA